MDFAISSTCFFDTKVDLTLYFMYLSMISSLPFWGLDY
nr:MAG TPA: hypothetical protein [Caudoviricetes sp.]